MEKRKSDTAKAIPKKGREKSQRLAFLTNKIRPTNENPPKNWLNLSVEEQIELQRKLGKVDNPFALLKGKYVWPEDETKDVEFLDPDFFLEK